MIERKLMNEIEKDREVVELLETLQETPQRNPEAAARGRARYLAEVNQLPAPVSIRLFQRLKARIPEIMVLRRKERRPMLATISAIFIALALVLGGGGVTAYAAQDSMPDDALYPAKLFFEDVQLGFTFDPDSKVDLLTDFANRRIDESVELASKGKGIPDKVIARLDSQLAAIMQVTADLEDDEEIIETIGRIRSELNDHVYVEKMLNLNQPDSVDPQLDKLRATLRNRHRVLEEGIEDPGHFQTQFRHEVEPTPTLTSTITTTVPEGGLLVDCLEPDCDPTGEPGAGDGPGNCEVPGECTPEENGLGPGPGPYPTATIVPGSRNPGNEKKP
jgi:hypothetical protein